MPFHEYDNILYYWTYFYYFQVYVGTAATTTKISNQGGGGWTGWLDTSIKGIERFWC